MSQRPNPEQLLRRIKAEEKQENRGKLKIYLGAAPGVGKTYTMLQDATAKRAQGLDVVVGLVETHGRTEVDTMARQFETLPRLNVDYRGYKLSEFDLDAALKRNPGLILIDEMAHTNAPGLRHAKRWQDIKELLDRGVDVYTTLNVQHVESLNDIVSQIVHSRVKETVPDSMLEMADTIELVDLPPEELIKRLQEGKVYFPAQAEMAAENFFRKGNLTALRELALRMTAQVVNAQVLLYRQGQGIKHIWPTKEKILVCVGTRPESSRLIRKARRIAASLSAEWIAIHVDAPRLRLTEDDRNRAIQNLRLAEQLGGETRILTGFDVVKELMNFAHAENITMILIHKQVRPRWKEVLFSSLADELVRNSGEIDVYVITDIREEPRPSKLKLDKTKIPWRIYGMSIGVVTLSTILALLICIFTKTSNVVLVYVLGVTVIALFGQIGPSILATVLSILAYDYFFVPPFYSFQNTNFQYIFTFFVMLVVSSVISYLTIITRKQADIARDIEQHTAALHMLSKQLASTRGVDKLLEIGVHYISEVFDSEVLALLPEENHLVVRSGYGGEQDINIKEQSVAQWVYDMNQSAGLGTDTLPFSDSIYVPMSTPQGPIGVLRVHPMQPKHLFTPVQMHLLEACSHQIAMAIEVDRLEEQSKLTELQSATDSVRSSLLRSVSHDLRTPLVALMGGASTLMEMGGSLDAPKIKKMGKEMYFEAEQLSRLINNLLQITYLEADLVKLEKEPQSLGEVIKDVVVISSKKLGKKPLHIQLPPDLPSIPFDRTLIQEVLLNLLDNAIKFTPRETPIDIIVTVEKENVLVRVEDKGPGIVMDELNKLFEKYYRGRKLTTERGLGLGLAICHSIIKAHGGKMWAENCISGGAAFCFTLPIRSIENKQ